MNEELKATLVTQPEFLGQLSEEIIRYSKAIDIPNMRYQTLWTYFYQSIQRCFVQIQAKMTPVEEFWIVYKEEKPISVQAFAHWYVMQLPHVGTVYIDHIYSWNTNKAATGMLADEFIKFGKKHHCQWYEWDAVNERVYNVFKKISENRGYNVFRQQKINCIGRKK